MGFILLWVESLAVSLLLVAWAVACVGRWRRRWLYTVVYAGVTLVLLFPYALVASQIGVMKFDFPYPDYPWFYYTSGLSVFFLAGAIALGVVGLRRPPTELLPTVAAAWPRGKLFLVWCIAVALHVATIENLSSAASRQIEALREESQKTLTAAVPASVPQADNALPLYEEAAEAFQLWNGSDQRWLKQKAASFDAKDRELLGFLQKREPVVRLLYAAAQRPACAFRADPRIPGRAQYNSLENVSHELALFLTVHCRWQLAQGNRQAAWQDVYTLFQFARHMRERTWINTSLLDATIEKQAIRSLQYVLKAVRPTADELAGVKIDPFFSWRRSIRDFFPVEAASGLWFLTLPEFCSPEEIQYYGWHGSSAAFNVIFKTGLYRIFSFPIDLAFYRRLVRTTETGLACPYDQAEKRTFSTEEREALRDPLNVGAFMTSVSGIAPWFRELPHACAQADARHATAVAALALARFQVKHKQLPKDLGALVPEFLTVVPQDPFDGQPLKYETTTSGALVYSVGRDRIEEGDAFKGPGKKPEKDDMTFELPHVAAKP
jgi:hypothetical protein